ncbi:transmembrane and coiled-coil domain-containing protein 4 [Ciona intestinalis]
MSVNDNINSTTDMNAGINENEKSEDKEESFVEKMDDIFKFSLASFSAISLCLLYDTPHNKDYRHSFIDSLVSHLSLSSGVGNTMKALSDDDISQESDIFIQNIISDKCIKENPLNLVKDLVHWCVTSSGGKYDSRSRFLLRHMTWQLHVKFEDLEDVEETLIKMLRERTEKEKTENDSVRAKKARNRKIKRFALVGIAAAGGGALIGLTGGLAAPLVAAGAGAIIGGTSAAVLGSVAGIAVITSLFGAGGAGLAGYKMKRRVGGIDQFFFSPLTSSDQLSLTITISGWLSGDNESNFFDVWSHINQSREQYSLVWESEHLMRLGNAFEYILEGIMSYAATEALKYTALAGLIAAIAWPATLVSAAGVIDNPWSVCLQRSVQAGRQLAEVLLAREHGQRPVTLIGYSLGARVIYFCLEEMAKRKKHSGIIEDVYLLGAAVSGKVEDWKKFSSVVAGHITNGYCRTDWLLRFLYRTSSRHTEIAGLQPIAWENRRMINIDLSSIIEGHLDYAKNMDAVLAAVGVRTRKNNEAKSSISLPNMAATATVDVPVSSKSCDDIGALGEAKVDEKEETKINATLECESNADENTSQECSDTPAQKV